MSISAVLRDDNAIWITLDDINGLCVMDTNDYSLDYISFIPGEEEFGSSLYFDIKRWEDKLILTPFNAKEIAIYDTKNKIWDKIPVYMDEGKFCFDSAEGKKFITSIVYEDSIYFIPATFPAIVKLNLRSNEIQYISDWIQSFDKEYTKSYYLFRQDIAISDDNMFYIGSLYYDFLAALNPENGQVSILRKGKAGLGNGYLALAYDNCHFISARQNEKKLILFSKDLEIEYEYCYKNIIKSISHLDYVGCIFIGGLWFFVPNRSDSFIRYDPIKNETKIIYIKNEPLYTCFWEMDGVLYCSNYEGIDVFDMDGNKIITIKISKGKSFNSNVIKYCMASNDYIIEDEQYDICSFAESLKI